MVNHVLYRFLKVLFHVKDYLLLEYLFVLQLNCVLMVGWHTDPCQVIGLFFSLTL